jgi:hypothetical protein
VQLLHRHLTGFGAGSLQGVAGTPHPVRISAGCHDSGAIVRSNRFNFRFVENRKEFATSAAPTVFESKKEGHQHSPMAFISINKLYFCFGGGIGTMPSRS